MLRQSSVRWRECLSFGSRLSREPGATYASTPMIGLTPRGARLLVEIDRAVEVAVVGEGDGLLAELAGALHEVGHAGEAVEEAELGVYVQVGEHGWKAIIPPGARRRA